MYPVKSVMADEQPSPQPPRRRRNRRGQGELLRDDLIEAAIRLLSEHKDPAAISIRQIASAAGVTPPAVYLHFPDKDTLLRVAANDQFARFRKALIDGAASSLGALETFYAIGRAYLRFARQFPGHYEALFCSGDHTGQPEDFRLDVPATEEQQGKAALQDVTAIMAGAYEELGVTGIDPLESTFYTWTALHGLVHQQRNAPLFPWPDDETMLRFVARGCGLPPEQG